MKLELNQSELMLIKEALTDLQSQLVGVGTKTNTIIDILNKVSESTKPKVKKKLSNKEYMFTFEGLKPKRELSKRPLKNIRVLMH
jgi:hypothetical protein